MMRAGKAVVWSCAGRRSRPISVAGKWVGGNGLVRLIGGSGSGLKAANEVACGFYDLPRPDCRRFEAGRKRQ